MGKVQDTISRINQRRKQRPSAEVALIIPSQQKPTRDSFPTGHKAVSNWLCEQSNASPNTTVASLLKALQHSNRLQNSPAERLRIMDLFRAKLQRLLPQLNTHYIGMDLPYSATAQFAYEQASSLLQELSYGYKIVLTDTLLRRGRLNRKLRTYATFHAMKAMGECGLRHAQSYSPWPDKSWRDINTLLLLAERERSDDDAVYEDNNGKKIHPNTIRELYVSIATFSVSNHEHLTPLQMDSLFIAVSRNSDSVHFLPERHSGKQSLHNSAIYSVALNSSYPPTADIFARYNDADSVRYFNLQPLHEILQRKASSENHDLNLSRNQLDNLHRIWTKGTSRTHARSIRHQSFFTQSGIKEISSALKNTTDAFNESLLNIFQTEWTLINESANGIGLRRIAVQECQANVGEVVAYKPEYLSTGTCICQVGVVRWIRNEDTDHFQIGLETIAKTVQSATAKKTGASHPHDSPQTEALLFTNNTDSDNQLMLLVPQNKFKLGETVLLGTDQPTSKYTPQVRLAAKVELNGNFECYALNNTAQKPVNTIHASMEK